MANEDYRTQDTHALMAQYPTPDGKWANLGTVCNISQEKLGLKPGLTSPNCQLALSQSLTKNQVQLLFKQASQIALDWRRSLEAPHTPDDVSQYAAATWHLCHNHSKDTTNNFVYAAFGDKILEQLSQTQLSFDFVVGQLNEYNQVPEALWKSDQPLDLSIQLKDGQPVWHITSPETGESLSFGTASTKNYQLPLGTKVKGRISGDLFTTARLDINHPKLKDTEIIIGNMVKYPKVGYEFRNEAATIVLSSNPNPPPQPIIRVDGQKLGQLDKAAVELFQKQGVLRDQLTFEATLTSLGQGKTREIVATTAKGTSFKIEKSHFLGEKDLKEREFTSEKISLTLRLEVPQKTAMRAHIKQDDGTLLPIAEFTNHPTSKASIKALTEAGLFHNNSTFEAKITSRVTAARIEIDPNTLEYPELGQWQQVNPPQTTDPLSPAAHHYLEVLSTQPALLHTFEQEWKETDGTISSQPTLGLTVDLNKVVATKAFLEKQQIPFRLLSPDDPRVSLESARGYGVFWMVESDVPPNLRQKIETAVEGVYGADLANISTISPYVEKLESIPKLSKNRLNDRLEGSRAAFEESSPIDIPQRTSPAIPVPTESKTTTLTADPESNGKYPAPTPAALQAHRTEQIAPVVRSYLELCQTHHKQGGKYTATWDFDSQILSLVKNHQLKMMATLDGHDWKSAPIPLHDPTQPNLTQEDVEHFKALAPQVEEKLSQRRAANRAWYESAKEFVVGRNPQLSTPQQIDYAIAAQVFSESHNPADVAQILSQGDLANQWRQDLPDKESRNQLVNYVKGILEQVNELEETQQQEDELTR